MFRKKYLRHGKGAFGKSEFKVRITKLGSNFQVPPWLKIPAVTPLRPNWCINVKA